MTVKELIAELQKLPQDFKVIMSSDAEGNDFSPLEEASSPHMYAEENSWRGNFVDREEVEEDEYHPNSIILWPAN